MWSKKFPLDIISALSGKTKGPPQILRQPFQGFSCHQFLCSLCTGSGIFCVCIRPDLICECLCDRSTAYHNLNIGTERRSVQ